MTSIWAHRGASANAPENTMVAFELAFEHGADGIEIDVQRTSDGVLVVCHDETIDRTSDGRGAIVDLSYEQLCDYDFSASKPDYSGLRIPRLDEVLDLVEASGRVINIELKNSIERYPGMEAEIDRLVCSRKLTGRVWYSSFNHQSLVELSSSPVPRGVLYAQQLVRAWTYASSFGAEALHPWSEVVDAEMVEAAHRCGMRVHPWTVDSPERMVELAGIGVDAIITNDPALAVATMGTHSSAR